MEPTDAIAVVRRYYAWRRGDESVPMFQPEEIGRSLDSLCNHAERLERELSLEKKAGRQIWIANERLQRELEQERQDRKQAEADICRALGERNDARKELQQLKEKHQ